MALTKSDKNYIDHVIGAYHEKTQDSIKMIIEMVQDKPTRSEMNRGFDELKEEIRFIRGDMAMHDMRISKLEGHAD